jgi:uncharacterized protein YacL
MNFADISHFNRLSDYLPILNAAILTDIGGILLLLTKNIESKYLREWYKKYTLSAVIMDVLILVIGAVLARLAYPLLFPSSGFSLVLLAGLAVAIQITHDILFAWGFNMVPRGKSGIADLFQDYGKEIGVWILVADAVMMVSTIVFSSLFASLSLHTNILLLIGLVYLIPYLLLSF